jgi:hypothetical protein
MKTVNAMNTTNDVAPKLTLNQYFVLVSVLRRLRYEYDCMQEKWPSMTVNWNNVTDIATITLREQASLTGRLDIVVMQAYVRALWDQIPYISDMSEDAVRLAMSITDGLPLSN